MKDNDSGCPPPLRLTDTPSLELFEQECDNDEEFSGFTCSSERIDSFFRSSREANPAISTKVSISSVFTDSTDWYDSSYEIISSQDSFDISSSESESESDYVLVNPSGFEKHRSMNGELQALSVHVISDAEAQMAPVEKPFKCPQCPFSCARKHDLETHMGTYGKEAYPDDNTQATAMVVVQQPESVTRQSPSSIRPRGLRGASAVSQMPFKCPHCSISYARKKKLNAHIRKHHKEASKPVCCETCGRRFREKPDLERHCNAKHLTQHRTTTVSGDGRLMSPLHLGSLVRLEL